MSTRETGKSDHWRSLDNPALNALSPEDATDIIKARVQDLFTGKVRPEDLRGNPTLQVTKSDRGTERLRAFVADEDAGMGYFDHEYYAGVVAPDEKGVMYVERRYPYPTMHVEETYRIDTTNPDNSTAYAWRDGETPAEIPKAEALGNVVHMLGTFAQYYTVSDYANANPGSREEHEFAHPDLRDTQPQAEPPMQVLA